MCVKVENSSWPAGWSLFGVPNTTCIRTYNVPEVWSLLEAASFGRDALKAAARLRLRRSPAGESRTRLVDESPGSLVEKSLLFKLLVTRFTHSWGRLKCGQSLPSAEEKILIFCTAPLPLPAKVTGMDESASQTPAVTLYFPFFSLTTIDPQTLSLFLLF